MNELEEYNRRYWKGGVIYNNPNDPDIWVRKLVGIGWTLNFAHRQSYLIVGVFILITAAIVISAIAYDRG